VTKRRDRTFDAGEVEVVVEAAGSPYRTQYFLLSVAAWVWNLMAVGSAMPDAPNLPYSLVVRNKNRDGVLFRDLVYYGQEAFDSAKQWAEDIKRVGVDDFVYKMSHGWRID
jgi:hypothetical protein